MGTRLNPAIAFAPVVDTVWKDEGWGMGDEKEVSSLLVTHTPTQNSKLVPHPSSLPMSSPYSEHQWQQINAIAQAVEARLEDLGVGLMMGGEPTFISEDDIESPQWQVQALGADKRQLAGQLLKQLESQFARGCGLLHYGQGKWYPGEVLPRWALGCFWRQDGVPLWRNPDYRAEDGQDYGHTQAEAEIFMRNLVKQLGVSPGGILAAHEPGTGMLAGYTLPLLPVVRHGKLHWSTCRWAFSAHTDEDGGGVPALCLIAGDSPIGYRLPLGTIAETDALESEATLPLAANPTTPAAEPLESPLNSIRVALSVAARRGTVHVFLPPLTSARSFVDLVGAIEDTVATTQIPVVIEGYTPPANGGIIGFQITPDPGVIEANIHPAENWEELVAINSMLYEAARQCRLCTQKFMLDGRCISTGGGAHVTLGGKTTEASPLLRRPDLLRSIITYWQNHPGLSYLFADLFVGPTSQSPRVDEARHESLYELEIAFQVLQPGQEVPPALVDRLLRNLLIDVTGNTHRAEFCIDKLFPIENPRTQLGLLEFRAVAMPPHEQMRLLQLLLIRALVAWFWEKPYTHSLIRWGTSLHDRFLLPHYIGADLRTVLVDLQQAGYTFEFDWFLPFFDFRFPPYGSMTVETNSGLPLQLELRHAIEPWNVLGEEATSSGTARYVDSSMERIQVTLRGAIGNSPNPDGRSSRYQVTCNGYPMPLKSTGIAGEYVGAVRFRARQLGAYLHPAVNPHSPLQFDVADTWTGRSLGGCTYHVNRPDGGFYDKLPATPQEAALRRTERFVPQNVAADEVAKEIPLLPLKLNPEYPLTLDLRRF
ncbi:transglutaminase family protein [Kovacikia minuta CCNUW1]|uniref:transglutaminase family protein n=1 Tax=Kovacikia minuta TaxID=2931930 RepID=UPI001CCEF5EC|nr:transglutaminase family protein [Kovacikia minuta]UBF26080.1 transglutaminase family protein [Kovacikia minuta CCNUW1]